MGDYGMLKFCRTQAIVTARVAPKSELQWYPYTPLRGAILKRASRFLGARDLRRRFTS